MKILITAFDPFGGDKTNPALEAVKLMPATIAGAEIVRLEVPTVFHKSAQVLKEALEKERLDYVLSVGQAGGRFEMTPERVAINCDDARIADNEGNQPIDVPVQADGEAAYFSQLPVKAMVAAMREAGVPASLSNTAGTFVCNHLMYQGLYLTHKEFKTTKAGFIHVPFLPEQVMNRPQTPSMSLETIISGLVACAEAIVAFHGKGDLQAKGGKEC